MSTFEALNYALRKTKDGVVVSFVVQPHDVTPELLNLPVGAHVVIEWKEYSEEEEAQDGQAFEPDRTEINQEAVAKLIEGPKPKTRFADMSLPAQAGIRCGDEQFRAFLRAEYTAYWLGQNDPESHPDSRVAYAVRKFCGVESRAELSTNREAANKWRKLESDYMNWKLTTQYSDVLR